MLCDKMTVKENLLFFFKFKDVQNIDAVIDRNLELFNLTSKADTLV